MPPKKAAVAKGAKGKVKAQAKEEQKVSKQSKVTQKGKCYAWFSLIISTLCEASI